VRSKARRCGLDLVAAELLLIRVVTRQPQAQLCSAGRGDPAQEGQVAVGPASGLGVDSAQRAEHAAVLVGQRHPRVGHHPKLGDGEVALEHRVLAGVGHHQRFGGADHVLAERVRQRRGPFRRPRLGQADHPGEHLDVGVDE
jgi:hypothetical protein